jgi:hypothetical protein
MKTEGVYTHTMADSDVRKRPPTIMQVIEEEAPSY